MPPSPLLLLLLLAAAAAASAAAEFELRLRIALNYSSAAYCGDKALLERWKCPVCSYLPQTKVVAVFDNTATAAFGFIGVDDGAKRILVAFRGTIFYSRQAVMDDLKYFETPYPESVNRSAVHRGFLEYLQSVQDQIRPKLQSLVKAHPQYEVWYTGHSLGAAVAILASVEFNNVTPRAFVYTFGTPRVGNFIFSEHFRGLGYQSYRVVHWRDIVVHLPPCTWDPFASSCSRDDSHPYHTVTEVFYDEPMTNFTMCNRSDGEDLQCSNQFSSLWLSIADHRSYFGVFVGQACKPAHVPPLLQWDEQATKVDII